VADTAISTFERHLDRLDLGRGLSAREHEQVVAAIRRLNTAVSALEGHGFAPTPFERETALATAVGLPAGMELWVKDETVNVSGSHKGRHLFGVAVCEALAPSGVGPWAIASCGNAALAASIVAAAAEHPLEVFVPTWADDAVVGEIESTGARVTRVEREVGRLGDPAYLAMVEAIAGGATAFSCQGTDTPSTIDGGRTLAFEMIDALTAHDHPTPPHLDRLFVQVGGGALASAVVTGLARCDLPKMPTVHAVQPLGNHPLVRAWDTVLSELLDAPPESTVEGRLAAAAALGRLADDARRVIVRRLRSDPARYMRPWADEPESYATGILDDVTYDWIPIIEAMLATGGAPVVPSEDQLRRAHALAHDHTSIPACPTGAAGLGGLIAVVEAGYALERHERLAVIFSGHQRAGDPLPS